ncbi:MAG: hypothetical protein ACTSWW_02240, partial [Promethearchaeota archaeon]
AVVIFSLTNYISKPGEIQLKLATFAFKWSLLPFSIASTFFVLYLYQLNGNAGILTYFYTICFTAVCVEFFHYPWEIVWINDKVGYTQNIENLFLVFFFSQFLCLIAIIIRTLKGVEKHVQIEKNTAQKDKLVPTGIIKEIQQKMLHLRIIGISYLLGIILGLISMIPGLYHMDYFGLIIVNLPQMIILYRDRNIMKLTRTSLKGVYLVKKSGLVLLDWNPKNLLYINPTLLGGLSTAIKTMAEQIFQSESSMHNLQFHLLSFYGKEMEYPTSQEPEKLAILIISDYLTPYLEYVVEVALTRFIHTFKEQLPNKFQETTQYRDFIPELEKLFKIFL